MENKKGKKLIIEKTLEAIDNNLQLMEKLVEATEKGEIPGITIGCTGADYHTMEFYKMARYPRRYLLWKFNYHLEEITSYNNRIKQYLETGRWE